MYNRRPELVGVAGRKRQVNCKRGHDLSVHAVHRTRVIRGRSYLVRDCSICQEWRHVLSAKELDHV